jgi:DNA repair exonuclease SbcCD ATPase subunit
MSTTEGTNAELSKNSGEYDKLVERKESIAADLAKTKQSINYYIQRKEKLEKAKEDADKAKAEANAAGKALDAQMKIVEKYNKWQEKIDALKENLKPEEELFEKAKNRFGEDYIYWYKEDTGETFEYDWKTDIQGSTGEYAIFLNYYDDITHLDQQYTSPDYS